MSILKKINTSAGMPYMHESIAPLFDQLRAIVHKGSGVDFLAKCADVSRAADFVSSKDGVANRSWHKTGRAFDYDQTNKAVIYVSQPKKGKQYFRTYLMCAKQDGTQGRKVSVRDFRGGSANAYLFDFTEAAEALGFSRIPAWNGWQKSYNRREFWHYEKRDGLTWDEAMLQLRGKVRPPAQKVLGLSDRGADVLAVQRAFHGLGILPKAEIDGIFGAKTKAAVVEFQRRNRISVDGLVGPMTRQKMGL